MAMKRRQQLRQQQQQQQQENKGSEQHNSYQPYHQRQIQKLIQCNKGTASKFKRSISNLEEDGAASAILLLACIACTPYFTL